MDDEFSVRITLSSLCRLYRNKRLKKECFFFFFKENFINVVFIHKYKSCQINPLMYYLILWLGCIATFMNEVFTNILILLIRICNKHSSYTIFVSSDESDNTSSNQIKFPKSTWKAYFLKIIKVIYVLYPQVKDIKLLKVVLIPKSASAGRGDVISALRKLKPVAG